MSYLIEYATGRRKEVGSQGLVALFSIKIPELQLPNPPLEPHGYYCVTRRNAPVALVSVCEDTSRMLEKAFGRVPYLAMYVTENELRSLGYSVSSEGIVEVTVARASGRFTVSIRSTAAVASPRQYEALTNASCSRISEYEIICSASEPRQAARLIALASGFILVQSKPRMLEEAINEGV
jgi:hypothetical protein